MIFITDLVLGIALVVFTIVGDSEMHLHVAQPYVTNSMVECEKGRNVMYRLATREVNERHMNVRLHQFDYNCASYDNEEFGIVSDPALLEKMQAI